MDILLAKITIIFALSYIVAAGVHAYRNRDGRKIKYYTIESSDGYMYEVAYANRKLAIADAKAMAYSGTAYEHVVGSNKIKVAFIW